MGKRSMKYAQAEEKENDENKIMGIPTNILIIATIIAFGGGAFVYFTYTTTQVTPEEEGNEFEKEIEENTYERVQIFGNTTDEVVLNISQSTSEIVVVLLGGLYGSVDDIMNATIIGVSEISGEQWGRNLIFKFKVTDVWNVTENIDSAIGQYLGDYIIYNAYFGKFTTGTAPQGMGEIYVLSRQKLKTGDIFVASAGNLFKKRKDNQDMGIVAVGGYKIQSGDTGIDAVVVDTSDSEVIGTIKSNFNLDALKSKLGFNTSISHIPPKILVNSALELEDVAILNNLDGVSAEVVNEGSTTITLNMENVTENERESYVSSTKQIIEGIIGKGGDLRSESDAGASDKIIIDEYSQFDCPACATALPIVHKVKEDYSDKVIINFKHFAFHENAKKPAEASECARDQGKFWEYHDKLFANQRAIAKDNLKQYAEELGLDMAKFNECLDSGEKESIVKDDISEASSRGVSGTPTFFVDGEKVPSYSQLYDIVKEKTEGKEKFILNYAVTSEIKNNLSNLKEIESVEVINGKTEVIFNNSDADIKSILGSRDYEIINGTLSFTLPEDADADFVRKLIEDAGVSDIEIKKSGFVSLDNYIMLSEIIASLKRLGQDNEHYSAILKPGTKIGDKIKVELGASIQTATMPDGSIMEKKIVGLSAAVEMSKEAIGAAAEEEKLKEEIKKEEPVEETGKMKAATIKTNKGTIKFKLYTSKAPKTTENFIKLTNTGFYEGLIFHRVIPGFMIQGGGFYSNGTQKESPYGAINLEINPDLVHDDGAVAMARTDDPNSATSQFYICDGPQHFLDGQYAVFGKVIEGMDIVKSIASVETATRQYHENWPVEDIIIESITIEEIET